MKTQANAGPSPKPQGWALTPILQIRKLAGKGRGHSLQSGEFETRLPPPPQARGAGVWGAVKKAELFVTYCCLA